MKWNHWLKPLPLKLVLNVAQIEFLANGCVMDLEGRVKLYHFIAFEENCVQIENCLASKIEGENGLEK